MWFIYMIAIFAFAIIGTVTEMVIFHRWFERELFKDKAAEDVVEFMPKCDLVCMVGFGLLPIMLNGIFDNIEMISAMLFYTIGLFVIGVKRFGLLQYFQKKYLTDDRYWVMENGIEVKDQIGFVEVQSVAFSMMGIVFSALILLIKGIVLVIEAIF